MSNYIKKCGCRSCRAGLRRRFGSETIKHVLRADRRKVKQYLRDGRVEDIIGKVAVPYTD